MYKQSGRHMLIIITNARGGGGGEAEAACHHGGFMGPGGNTDWKSQMYSGRKMEELRYLDRKLRLDFVLWMLSWI